MKSDTITVEQLFQNRRQYCVPFYQRAYVWTLEDQWEQLWEDIRTKAEARLGNTKFAPHFLGAVVLDPQQRDGLIGVEAYHIIDGQQRMTTLHWTVPTSRFGHGRLFASRILDSSVARSIQRSTSVFMTS